MNGVTETSHSMEKNEQNILYHKLEVTGGVFVTFLVLNNEITLCMNRINYQNDHSKNFVETSNSNTLFLVKLI